MNRSEPTSKMEVSTETDGHQIIPGNDQENRPGFGKCLWYCLKNPDYAWQLLLDWAEHPIKGRLLFLGGITFVWLSATLLTLCQARNDSMGLIISLAAVITAAVAAWQICILWRAQRVVTISREELAKATTWIRLLAGAAVALISATWISNDLGAVFKAIPGSESAATFVIIGALAYGVGSNYPDYCKLIDRAKPILAHQENQTDN